MDCTLLHDAGRANLNHEWKHVDHCVACHHERPACRNGDYHVGHHGVFAIHNGIGSDHRKNCRYYRYLLGLVPTKGDERAPGKTDIRLGRDNKLFHQHAAVPDRIVFRRFYRLDQSIRLGPAIPVTQADRFVAFASVFYYCGRRMPYEVLRGPFLVSDRAEDKNKSGYNYKTAFMEAGEERRFFEYARPKKAAPGIPWMGQEKRRISR